MSPLDECCYVCLGCERVTCRDAAPSPGEVDHVCADCYNTEDDEAVAS